MNKPIVSLVDRRAKSLRGLHIDDWCSCAHSMFARHAGELDFAPSTRPLSLFLRGVHHRQHARRYAMFAPWSDACR
jgi:hypothetical protein